MNVLLLNPVTRDGTRSLRVGRCQGKVIVGLWPNVEYGVIAALLAADGHRATILDANHLGLSWAAMLRRAVELAPDVVFVLSITATLDDDVAVVRELAGRLPGATFAWWGTHASVRPDDYLSAFRDPRAVVVRREPDLTARELVRAVASDRAGLAELAGLSVTVDGASRHNPDRPFVADLDSLPMPSHEAMGTGSHLATDTSQPFALIKTSRGCPANCVFCTTHAFHGSGWRPRSPAAIVDEIAYVSRTRGVRDFFLQSDVFSRDRAWTLELCERLRAADLGVTWFANSRVDTVDDEVLAHMKAAGCRLVALGVESGSNRVLRAIRKGATAERGEQTLAACRRIGLPALTYWVFGLPGESPDTIEETLAYIDRTAPDYAHFYTPTPLPGSRLFDQLGIAARVEAGELAWSDFFQGVSAQFVSPEVSVTQVSRAVRRAYVRFYTNPRRLLREGMRLRSWGALRGRLGTVYNMVRNYVLDKE